MSVNMTFLLALADPLQEGETAAKSAWALKKNHKKNQK